jgi:hypothetical protein
LIIASLPWHAPQVDSMFFGFVRDSGSFARRMPCVPWQCAGRGQLLPPAPPASRVAALDRVLVAGRAFDGLQLLRVRDLSRCVGVTVGALDAQRPVHRGLELRRVDADRFAGGTLGFRVLVAQQAGGVRVGRFLRTGALGERRVGGDQRQKRQPGTEEKGCCRIS